MSTTVRLPSIAAIGLLAGSLLGVTPIAASTIPTIAVHPGDSIQAAIDHASPGATIKVAPGTYREYLVVDVDGVRLVGDGAVLKPPAADVSNACSFVPGSLPLAGVCIAPISPPDTVRVGVTLVGFTIRGFPNWGVYVGGAAHTTLAGLDVSAGTTGVVVQDSTATTVSHSRIHHSAAAGLSIVESPHASALVNANDIYANGIGLAVSESSHGLIDANRVHDNCLGIGLFNADDPRSAPVSDWTVHANTVVGNDRACPGDPDSGSGPTSGIGIVVYGADHARVTGNLVRRNVPGGPTRGSGGIVVLSSAADGGSDPLHVTVAHNELAGNAPADLVWDGTGRRIAFSANHCGTSAPAGLCARTSALLAATGG